MPITFVRSLFVMSVPFLLTSQLYGAEKGNPKIVLEGEEMKWAAELYNALPKVKEITSEANGLQIKTKTIGGIECKAMSLPGDNPIQPSGAQHKCTVKANLSSAEIESVYNALSVKAVDDIPSVRTEYKMAGSLIFMKDEKFKLLQNSACKDVKNTKSADACFAFWAEDVFIEYEGSNVTAVFGDKAKKQKFADLMSEEGVKLPADFANDTTNFAALMGMDSPDGDLLYFTLKSGRYVVPTWHDHVTVVDIDDFDAAAAEKWTLGDKGLKSLIEGFIE